MKQKVLLLTPPFTQLNTPYPATAYLKGFLNTKGYASLQADLGIEVILKIFSRSGLQQLFDALESSEVALSDNAYRIYCLRHTYISTIEPVIRFLQHKNPTLAHSICDGTYLPEGSRFAVLEDLEWAFGTMGLQDKARHLATLYLEDLADLIKEAIDPHFGFSRYAERLGRTASHFDDIDQSLRQADSMVSRILKKQLAQYIEAFAPSMVCLSVPFPGNLFGALKCGQYIKTHHPEIKVVMGGGYANTELRRVGDERLFDYIDLLTLADGEAPLLFLLEHLEGKRPLQELKRVFARQHGVVSYFNGAKEFDIPQRETGTPDYRDLKLHDYLSVIEIVNPMHRLWSDGRWNKLTLAHGCYWGKCSFCDVSLDYIQRYEPVTAALICDRIEEIITQTQQNGFHFVDEAAPPALMRDLALEIIRRKLTVTWWTNIRFEKRFSADLCRLLKASGCIAISGGLEVASDRLLTLMKKGVTVAQVARVADHFTRAGIMVHAYLMYGFPTQTAQETIDSLEMVRQLFEEGVVQSGFWHQFAMTSHSPVGLDPAAYQVKAIGPTFGGFADNDLYHEDEVGCEHELFSEGLRKSLFNYMHGVGFEFPLQDWFEFETPQTSVQKKYILRSLNADPADKQPTDTRLVLWLGQAPTLDIFEEEGIAVLSFYDKKKEWGFETSIELGRWLAAIFDKWVIGSHPPLSFKEFRESYTERRVQEDFPTFLTSFEWRQLRENGLLLI
ncbi:MAG: radical SAM protein [Saprospiraceae bacterium]|nr:radical SAM protein [Saprospiraceae bacterium]